MPRILVIVVAALVATGAGFGAPEKKEPDPAPQEPAPRKGYWETDESFGMEAALAVIGRGEALGALGALMLARGSEGSIVPLRVKENDSSGPDDLPWKIEFDRVLPIHFRYLEEIRDHRPLPEIDPQTKQKIQLDKPLPPFWDQWMRKKGPEWGWYMAYNDALWRSHDATMDQFKKSAEDYKHIVWQDLKTQPDLYRGKIITVTGKMPFVRKKDAPRFVPPEVGTPSKDGPQIYTGYVIGPTPGAPPFAITFVKLPQGVEPAENLNLEVTFHGYFLSLTAFPSDKKGPKKTDAVVSPYLVGKTIIVNSAPPRAKDEPDTAYSYFLVVGALGGLLIIGILVAGLNIWLRRGDQRVQSQLSAVRHKSQHFDFEPAEGEGEPTLETPATPPSENGKPTEPPGSP